MVLENLAGGFTGTGDIIINTLLWIVIGLGVGGIIWKIMQILQYNITINIEENTSWGKRRTRDKAKIVKDKNNKSVTIHELLRNKDSWKGQIPSNAFIPVKKAFGISYEVDMYKDTEGNLHIINPIELSTKEEAKLRTISPSSKKWAMLAFKENLAKYASNDWFDKYGNAIIQGAIIMMVLVTMVIIVRELGNLTEMMGSISGSLQAVADSLTTQTITTPLNNTEIIT